MKDVTPGTAIRIAGLSEMMAFASADLATEARYSKGKSGGHKVIRRATPSSSRIAAAAASWSVVAIRTDCPDSSSLRPPSAEPTYKSRSAKLDSAPKNVGSHASTVLLSASQSDAVLFCNILIKVDEITKGHRKLRIFRGTERVDTQRIFKPCYKNRER